MALHILDTIYLELVEDVKILWKDYMDARNRLHVEYHSTKKEVPEEEIRSVATKLTTIKSHLDLIIKADTARKTTRTTVS